MQQDTNSSPNRINTVLADVRELLIRLNDYMDDRSDVEDGDYGTPRPNVEMSYSVEIGSLIDELEKHIS